MSFRLFHKYLDEIKILSRLQKFNSRPVSIGKVSWSQLKTKERSELQREEIKVSRSPRQFHAYQTRSSSLEATSVKIFSPNKSVFEYKHPTKAPRISNHFNLSGVSDNKEDSQNWRWKMFLLCFCTSYIIINTIVKTIHLTCHLFAI